MILVVEVHDVARDRLRGGLRAAEARDAFAFRRERPRRVALEDHVHELTLLEPRVSELSLMLLDPGRIPLPVDDRVDRARHSVWVPHWYAYCVRLFLLAGLPGLGTSRRDRRIGSRI